MYTCLHGVPSDEPGVCRDHRECAPYAYPPRMFRAVRVGPEGPDTPAHMFCVRAAGDRDLVRTGDSQEFALVYSFRGSDPMELRLAVQRLAAALNEQVARFYRGEFHR